MEVLGACGRQGVNANAAVGGGDGPFGFDQVFFEKALKSGVKGAFFDLQQVIGGTLDVLDECVAVEGLAFEGAENHHLQGAGEEIALLWLGFFHERGVCSRVSVRGHFVQGLEQNSIRENRSQEFSWGDLEKAIEFAAADKCYWRRKLLGRARI